VKKNEKKIISRRSFLNNAGLAMAAPLIVPSTVFGAKAHKSPGSKITIGVIGSGGQANGLTENAIKHKNTRIVAVCDVDRRRLAEAKSKVDHYYDNEDCTVYTDYREVLAREDIDAVIVATPDHWHALICVEAAHRGKDIYCEKPLTWSLGEGQAVVKAVTENKRVFQTGSMQRSGKDFKTACELVRNGYLGKIKHILVALPNGGNALWVDEFPPPPAELDWEFYVGPAEWAPYHEKRCHWDWRWWMGFGGSQMMDWIGHHGDIAHMAMNWDHTGPVHVQGVAWEMSPERNNLYNAPQKYQFECTYADGTTMTVGSSDKMPDLFKECGSLGTMFFGDNDQWLYVDRSGIKASDPELLQTRLGDTAFRFRKGTNHMTDFLQCIESREECIAPVYAGHRSASIGHLGKIACTLNVGFNWDPEKEVITDNPAMNALLTRQYRGGWSLDAV